MKVSEIRNFDPVRAMRLENLQMCREFLGWPIASIDMDYRAKLVSEIERLEGLLNESDFSGADGVGVAGE
jgi:hypothetical protein